MRKIIVSALLLLTTVGSQGAHAQEACLSSAKAEISDWIENSSGEFQKLITLYENSSAPYEELTVYNGVQMPIVAALVTEKARHEKKAKKFVSMKYTDAERCAARFEVALPRATYDVARTMLGLTVILPERATRIDFAEIARGNVLGGRDALIPKAGRDISNFLKGLF